jgi:hypothetical protein
MTDEEKRQEEWNEYEKRQDRVDEWFEKLRKDLKLEKTEATQCLVDWVWGNADIDYLSEAVERLEVDFSEFVCAAIEAWLKPRGGKLSADDAFEAIYEIICTYREQ